MAYDFAFFKRKAGETEEWLKKEYQSVRTGRATPAILDNVRVESYGAMVPLSQTANIGSEDARTLRITPWDASQIKAIEKGITNADLGVSPVVDERGLRVVFPELTAERRELLKKTVREKLEHARVALRRERDEVWNDIQKKEKDGEISEDEKFRSKDALQKLIDEAGKKLEEMAERKEREISQ